MKFSSLRNHRRSCLSNLRSSKSRSKRKRRNRRINRKNKLTSKSLWNLKLVNRNLQIHKLRMITYLYWEIWPMMKSNLNSILNYRSQAFLWKSQLQSILQMLTLWSTSQLNLKTSCPLSWIFQVSQQHILQLVLIRTHRSKAKNSERN